MTLDEILDGYEDAWRSAALRDQRQFFAAVSGGILALPVGSVGMLQCAVLLPRGDDLTYASPLLQAALGHRLGDWRCPTCHYPAATLWVAMVHINNAHHWTWIDFANKFRDALAQGMAR